MSKIKKLTFEEFLENLEELGFRKVTTKKKLKEATDNPKKRPKRATFANELQDQYVRNFANGDTARIYTSIIEGKFAKTGTAWVVGIDHSTGRKISRPIPRTRIESTLLRICAYAELIVKIFEIRPRSVTLLEKKHDEFYWLYLDGQEHPINFINYSKLISEKFRKYVEYREKTSQKWIADNPDRKRRRARRKKYELVA